MTKVHLNKLVKRGYLVAQAFMKNYSGPLFNAILAWIVIRNYSADLWGDFVKVQLFVNLGSQFCNWSSKTELMRSFSTSPLTMLQEWRQAYSERIPLLFIVIPLGFIFLNDPVLVGFSALWLTARYIILSFEPIILFQRRYILGILTDMLSFTIALLAIFLKDDLDIHQIVGIIAIAELAEAVLLICLFRNTFPALKPKSLKGTFLKNTAWLFLLVFSAFAGLRADLLCAAFYLSKADLAFYQVFVNFLLGLQSLSNILVLPYVQNYYRMSTGKIIRSAFRMLLYGVVICILISPVIFFILKMIYKLPVEPIHGLLAILYALPVYYYTLLSYILLKKKHDKDVFFINISGVIVNVGLALILLPRFGVTGGILSTAVSHILLLILFYMRVMKLKREGTPKNKLSLIL